LQLVKNEEEEVLEEDMADYRKGEGQIIVEEFMITLMDLPGTIQYLFIIAPLNFLTSYVSLALDIFYNRIIQPREFINLPLSTVN